MIDPALVPDDVYFERFRRQIGVLGFKPVDVQMQANRFYAVVACPCGERSGVSFEVPRTDRSYMINVVAINVLVQHLRREGNLQEERVPLAFACR